MITLEQAARFTLARIVDTIARGDEIPRAQLVADAGLIRQALDQLATGRPTVAAMEARLRAVPTLCECGQREGEGVHRGCQEGGFPDYPALAAAALEAP